MLRESGGRGRRPWALHALLAVSLFTITGRSRSQGTPPAPVAEASSHPAAPAIGVNLNLIPRRIVLDRKTRSATVYAINRGDTAATFDVTLVDRVMTPDGQIRAFNREDGVAGMSAAAVGRLAPAKDMVVATPRRITLAPGKGQTIRLRALLPEAVPGGPAEYRTHLTVANVPPPDTGVTAEEAAAGRTGQLVFRVRSILAISIPVILRTAPVDAHARIERPRLSVADAPPQPDGSSRKVPALDVDLVRVGASSLFGNVAVRAGARNDETIGAARGVGVYPEIERRSLRVMLQRPPHPGEKLTIIFTDDDARPGAELARTSFEVP